MKKVRVEIIEPIEYTKEFINSCELNGYMFDYIGKGDYTDTLHVKGIDREWYSLDTGSPGRTLTIIDDFEFPPELFEL